jgi:hypothetical protein
VSDQVRASGWMRTVLTGAALVACLAAVHCGGGNSATGPTPPTNTRLAIRTRCHRTSRRQ